MIHKIIASQICPGANSGNNQLSELNHDRHTELDHEQALAFVQSLLTESNGPLDNKLLNELECKVFQLAWAGNTYDVMAKLLGYENAYLRDIGSQLFDHIEPLFSDILAQQQSRGLGKKNFRSIIQRAYCDYQPNQCIDPNPPPQRNTFLGREEDVLKLHDRLQSNSIILIHGEAGLGKTTLARKYLEQYNYRVIQTWMLATEGTEVTPAAVVVEEWLRNEFGQDSGSDFNASLSRLRYCLNHHCKTPDGQPIGIFIDNLDSALDGRGRFRPEYAGYLDLLRMLADADLPIVTVLTSREKLREGLVIPEPYRLEGLTQETWQRYFQHHQLSFSAATLQEVWQACAGNPKAMKILKGAAISEFDRDLDACWQSYDRNLSENNALQDLIQSQIECIQQRDPAAYRLLCRMAAYRYQSQDQPSVPLAAVKALLWDVAVPQQQAVIQSLQGRSLLEARRNEKFWLHPMIQSEAAKRLHQDQSQELCWEIAHRQAAQFWLDWVETIETVEDALQFLEAYYHYIEIGDYEEACNVLVMLKPNRWQTRIEVGWLFYRFSLLQQMTLAIVRVIDHIPADNRAVRLHNLLGYTYRLSGDFDEALDNHAKALAIIETLPSSIDIDRLKISALFNLGLCYRDLWQLETAIAYFHQVAELTEATQTLDYAIYAKCCLAYLYSCQKDFTTARHYINRISALALQQQLTSWGTGCSLLYLAHTYRNLGDLEGAIEQYQDTLHFAKANQFTQIEAKAYHGFGQVARLQQHYNVAFEHHNRAIELFQQIGAKCDLAEAYTHRAASYRAIGDIAASHADIQQARQLFKQIGAFDRLGWMESID